MPDVPGKQGTPVPLLNLESCSGSRPGAGETSSEPGVHALLRVCPGAHGHRLGHAWAAVGFTPQEPQPQPVSQGGPCLGPF